MAVFAAFFGLLLAGVVTAQVEITPREAVRRVGEDLQVLCKVSYKIDICRMTVGTTSYRLKPEETQGEVVYSGRGLEFGECGATIKQIREEWNGNITCYLPPPSGPIELSTSMNLIVARAPEQPILLSPQQASFKEGEQFNAQCISRNGRPHATITWLLDDQPIPGAHEPSLETDPTTGLVTVRQNMTRALQPADSGKRLVCRVRHPAVPAPRDVARQLVVNFPPSRVDGEGSSITIFGLKLGTEGRINVTVRASPAPRAEWTIADQRLVAPSQNEDSTVTALQPIPLGGNMYNITLVLSRVSKEDVERAYYLRVLNENGRDEFALRITTMAEPAGVELEAGAIVGIVVGVLALLVAVFLIVFARATRRWCFAGRRDPKSSGESTPGDVLLTGLPAQVDTESATAPRDKSRLAALGARVRAALPRSLPRSRDKLNTAAANAEQTNEPSSEEKKGVVYAELALADSGERPPAPVPAPTDYAEIVYNTEDKDKAAKTAKE